MAHTILEVGGRVEIIEDLDLLALLSLLLDKVQRESAKYSTLRGFLSDWRTGIALYGPGTMDLELEGIVESALARRELEALLLEVMNSLEQFGDTIPGSLLSNLCMAPGVEFVDYSTEMLRNTISRFQRLVTMGS